MRRGRLAKGAPSGYIISLVVHAALAILAGGVIVFSFITPKDTGFVQVQIPERPKMPPPKPRVKISRNPKPQASSKLVAHVPRECMPEFCLPDLPGNGDDLLGGALPGDGNLIELPDFVPTTLSPNPRSTGNDLIGTFYDFKRTASGLRKEIAPEDVDSILYRFMKQDWNRATLARYYKSPRKVYSSTICIPTVQSTLAPEAFGERETEGYAWAVLYCGKLVYPEDIRFRFRGVGDKLMAVRVNGKVVLFCAYNPEVRDMFSDIWTPRAPDNRVYPMAEDRAAVGDWIELKAGEPVDLEVLIGERQGGLIYHILCVEVDGMEYPRNPYQGGPTLPVFRTDVLARSQIDAIYTDLYPGDACLTNGPVFCDYIPESARRTDSVAIDDSPPAAPGDPRTKVRTWSVSGGRTLEGVFRANMGAYVLVEDASGAQHKLPVALLSDADQTFVELISPPRFSIEFSKRSSQVPLRTLSPYDNDRPLQIHDYIFGAKVRQHSAGDYAQELKIEYFAVGEEVEGDSYVLLDRGESVFVPAEDKYAMHEFHGKPARLKQYANRASAPLRGIKYGGYLITLTDVSGRIIQYETSNEFLFTNLKNLGQLPIRAYFDRSCRRVYPTRPSDDCRGPGAQ